MSSEESHRHGYSLDVPRRLNQSDWLRFVYWHIYPYHPCMVYLPTFTIKKTPNACKYTVHGWYGLKNKLQVDSTRPKTNTEPKKTDGF